MPPGKGPKNSSEENKAPVPAPESAEKPSEGLKSNETSGLEAELQKIIEKALDNKMQISSDTEAEAFNIIINNLGQPEQLEEDPQLHDFTINQLESWGCTPTDIDRSTIVIEKPSDEKIAQINELVRNGKMPMENYETNVGVYQYSIEVQNEYLIYTQGYIDEFLAKMENQLRIQGDTLEVENPNMLGSIFGFYTGVREKVDVKTVKENIKELGLEEYFPNISERDGIYESMEDYKSGAMLADILRNNGKDNFLKQFDIQEVLINTAQMVERVHQSSGRGIGELLGEDVLIKVKDGKIAGARLTLPDMKYHEEVASVTQKAYDLLDLCFSVGTAGMQVGGEQQAIFNIQTILKNYKDQNIKREVANLASQGLPRESMHNNARLGFDRLENKEEAYVTIRDMVLGHAMLE